MFVTGMHRSGTSLVAAVLEQIGVSFGPAHSMLEAGAENPHGFWEQRAVTELDDDVLRHLGGTWSDPPVLAEGWVGAPDLEPLRARVRETFATVFRDTAVRGIKDPRLSLLQPLWRPVAGRTVTVLVLRDPREVAMSLATRDGIAAERAAYLWLRYVVAAARDAPEHLTVHHDELFTDPADVADRLAGVAGVALPDPTRRRAIEALIDEGARRSRRVEVRGPNMRVALRLHELLRAPPGDTLGRASREMERLHHSWRRRAAIERLMAGPRRRLAERLPRTVVARFGSLDRIRYGDGGSSREAAG